MRKLLPLILYISIPLSYADGQAVLANSGDHISTSSGSVSWTIGEPICQTLSGPGGHLTQGFHQPNTVASVVAEPVPTLGQWGLIICMLLLLTVSVVALRDARERDGSKEGWRANTKQEQKQELRPV